MKAMILAAGRGQRMRPLTDHTPKPLLPIAGQPLIAHHLIALKKIGVDEIVINVSYLADQIQQALGDGSQYGVNIHYSVEPNVLETGGGIYQALPLLGNEPFIAIAADIWTDYPLQKLPQQLKKSAHLVFVDNPTYHPDGDFCLAQGKVSLDGENKLTFASIAIYHPELFKSYRAGIFPLVEVLHPAIAANQITGEHYQGEWNNLGTPAQWLELTQRVGNFYHAK